MLLLGYIFFIIIVALIVSLLAYVYLAKEWTREEVTARHRHPDNIRRKKSERVITESFESLMER